MEHSRFCHRKGLHTAILAVLAFLETGLPLHAQLDPLLSPLQAPQAKSQEELDVYLRIPSSSDPLKTVHEVEELASKYPKSDLLRVAYQYEMLAYQQMKDFNGLLQAGQRALKLEPRNMNTLLTLALAIPKGIGQRPDKSGLLQQAEDYAHQALQELARMRVPRQISMDQWEVMRAEMDSHAHEALGSIAMKRGDLATAIAEFKTSALGNPKPDGRQFYCLGIAYAEDQKTDSAQEALQRAVELGPSPIRELALQELKKLNPKVGEKR